ncbi:MAG TPA: hypothetical protein VM123_00300 [archaeon]|nr:hypothetical protein [archaeon]
MTYDTYFWVAVASAIAAWAAALFAYLAARISKRSLRLAELQENRRQPKLVPYLSEAYYKKFSHEKYTIYAFFLSISNPSDIDNSIAYLEFKVKCALSKNNKMAIKVTHNPKLSKNFGGDEVLPIYVPARIDAHQTITGWVFFRINDAFIDNYDFDSYTIIIKDSQNALSHLEPIIVRELADEKEISEGNH